MMIKDAGFTISRITLHKYFGFLEEVFMLYQIPIYDKAEKVRNRNYNKVYAVDWQLADAVAPGEGIDLTRKFENCVSAKKAKLKFENEKKQSLKTSIRF